MFSDERSPALYFCRSSTGAVFNVADFRHVFAGVVSQPPSQWNRLDHVNMRELARQRPWFGWGGYSRNWPYDPQTGAIRAESNPMVVAGDASRILWADLHGHSNLSDGTGTLDPSRVENVPVTSRKARPAPAVRSSSRVRD